MKKSIIAIGAHADDIELRAGGTLLKFIEEGYEIVYVMSTNNFAGIQLYDEPDGIKRRILTPEKQMKVRQNEAKTAAKFYKTSPVHWNYPQRCYNRSDGSLEELNYGSPPLPEAVNVDKPNILTAYEHEQEVTKVMDFFMEINPEMIITHSMAQKDLEHVATCLLVTKSFWKAVKKGFKGGLLYWRDIYPGLGNINMQWDTFIDIEKYEEKKLSSLAVHKSQACSRRLDSYRELFGEWGKVCGCKTAEIFTTVKLPEDSFRELLTEEIEKNTGLYSPDKINSDIRII